MALNVPFLQMNCEFVIENCNFLGPVGESCVNEFCHGFPSTSGTCPEINLDPDNCCGSSNPASCLNTFAHGSGGGGGGGNPCASVLGALLACSSATPAIFPSGSFVTAGPLATSLASCLCYDTKGAYDPGPLDGFASECVASGSAAHPTYYSYGTLLNGFCTNVGKPAGATPSTTAAVSSSVATGSSTAKPSTTAAPSVTSSVPSTTPSSGAIASSTSSSKVSTTATSSPAQTTSPITSSTAGSTATTKSFGVKNSLQTYAILLLGASMVLSVLS